MKKLASILALVFAFTVAVQAQKKERENEKSPRLSVEQHTDLAVKKMTLGLDLTNKQQDQIKPLMNAQAAEKKAAMQSRKENKKPTADEIYAMRSAQLDNQIAFKNSMKNILNKEQFEKFEQMKKERKGNERRMMMRKKQAEKSKNERR
ncbi:hypothetical protein [Polaribacter glomeratus]|uniref:DUF4890 domain-containing protein n=1 Tax=Polaribacter glomeratus TaxID=102 RepID=A0A2S7WZ05_9FLAO|nr:hypothetical protein [Polaribacter glomeratus]PQJ82827.1 hypothetical protein BTO16_09670 [Polaribacter glomeratus]TXD65370.1 hypothetical protein ESX12_11150 [Polaribacter glomeratus]